ncbi:MAG: DUF2207 domain-containing protein [Bacilli bacterium]|nr:DUF2207 domain-containing protein [Bacilli bacterium]MDD4809365.1 DUF2207 domain-containing protein [Bacilli bacterium]
MQHYEAIYYGILVFWYILFIFFIIYLSLFHGLEYRRDFKGYYYEQIPSKKTAGQLSVLLYRKVIPEVITSIIISLTNRGILKLEAIDDDYMISLNNSSNLDKLPPSERFIITMFIETMGDNNQISFSNIHKYCESQQNCSEFLLNYQIWMKIIRKESNINNFYESKSSYSKIKFYKIITIILFILNIISGYYLIAGFLLIIPAYFLQLYFFKIYKRTRDANEDYHKWMAFKNYLTKFSEFNINDHQKNEYLYYAPVLKVKKIDEKLYGKKCYSLLDKAIQRCVRRSSTFNLG